MTLITFSLSSSAELSATVTIPGDVGREHLAAAAALLVDLASTPVVAASLVDAIGESDLSPLVARQLLNKLMRDGSPAVSPLEVL